MDRKDPTSLIRMVPYDMGTAMEEHIAKEPKLFDMNEQELLAELARRKQTPFRRDHRLRLAFWREFDRAIAIGKPKMVTMFICAGLCDARYFLGRYTQDAGRLAWLLCPPPSYEAAIEEALSYGIEELRDILGAEMFLSNGSLNVKVAELKVKVVMMLDQRARGAVVQKGMILHMDAAKDVSDVVLHNSMEEIERKIKLLESKAAGQGAEGKQSDAEMGILDAEVT